MPNEPVNCCKVGRVAEKHGSLEETDSLVDKWKDGASVRSLTETFNESVIDATIDDADMSLSRCPGNQYTTCF